MNETTGAFNGVVSDPRPSADPALFRRYASSLQTSVVMCGNEDSWARPTVYEVGRRYELPRKMAFQTAAVVDRLNASFTSSVYMAAEFVSLAKKYSNFTGTWAHMDLAAVVERLAMTAALCTSTDAITSNDMAGGAVDRITVLGNAFAPVSASTSHVFIPRVVEDMTSLNVYAALIAACNGVGSTVCTDVLQINAVDNSVVIPTVVGYDLGVACVEALRILGANYAAHGAGAIFAVAVTKGIHSGVTVVGHTDEAGYIRRVLRRTTFQPSYGGIHPGHHAYAGIPSVARPTASAMAGWVDSLALVTAALVGESDPGVQVDGDWFPTVVVARPGERVNAGVHTEGTEAMARDLSRSLAASCRGFVMRYVQALTRAFATYGCEGVAEATLCSAFMSLAGEDDRHLRFPSVAPFFWVEPTSLVAAPKHETPGGLIGSGALCSPGQESVGRLFEAFERAGPGGGDRTMARVRIRSARTCGLINHLVQNPLNGLGSIRIRQLDPESVLHTRQGVVGDTRQQLINGLDLGSMLWTRGQSRLPAPGELLNISGNYGVEFRHVTMDEADFTCRIEHLPRADEIDATVTYRVGRPHGLPAAVHNYENSDARRGRTLAAAALSAARMSVDYAGSGTADFLPFSLTCPVFTNKRNRPDAVDGGGERPDPAVPARTTQDRTPVPVTQKGPDGVGPVARAVVAVGPSVGPKHMVRAGPNVVGGNVGRDNVPPPGPAVPPAVVDDNGIGAAAQGDGVVPEAAPQ